MPITEIDARLQHRNSSGDTTVIYPISKADNIEGTLPIDKGGTGATTATAALTNLGITATATELNYIDGVTSNIQTQLNGKAASSHNHSASHITSGTLSSDRLPIVPIAKGGTGASNVATARANLGAALAFTYGTTDISAGSTSGEVDGTMHLIYTTKSGVWDHVKSIFITVNGVWRLVWTQPYTITTNLTGVEAASSSNPTTIVRNGTATLTFGAKDGYTLPETVTVTGATHTWSQSVGVLTLSNPTGNVTVTITGVAQTYSITTNLTGVTMSSTNPLTSSIKTGASVSGWFVADDGYQLPKEIAVENAEYIWDSDTGYLSIYNPTGNVTVRITASDEYYYTYVVCDGETYACYNRSDPSTPPPVTISTGVEYTPGGDQYIHLSCEEMPWEIGIYTFESDTQNLDGFAWTDADGNVYATYTANTSATLGANATAYQHQYIYVKPIAVDATMYQTSVTMSDGQEIVYSHKNFSPGIEAYLSKTDGVVTFNVTPRNSGCVTTGNAVLTYQGEATCSGIESAEGDIYNLGTRLYLDYIEEEDQAYEFSWVESVVVADLELRPLVFVSRNGLDFRVFSRYGTISNIEYGWKWKSGDTGTKETVYDDSTGEHVDVSWHSDQNLCGEEQSKMTSRDGKIFLRGDNAVLGFLGVNNRGIGLSFTRPVYAYGDACAIMCSTGILETVDIRLLFCLFVDSTNLLCPPRLPSPKLYDRAYQGMFFGCSSMRLYSEPTDGYTRAWTVPSSGTLELLDGEDSNPLFNAFADTAGPVTDAAVNTTYYIADGDVVDDGTIYSIITDLTNVTADGSNPTTIAEGDSVELYFTANSGYSLPTTIQVGGAADVTWKSSIGKLTLRNPITNVTVFITGVART